LIQLIHGIRADMFALIVILIVVAIIAIRQIITVVKRVPNTSKIREQMEEEISRAQECLDALFELGTTESFKPSAELRSKATRFTNCTLEAIGNVRHLRETLKVYDFDDLDELETTVRSRYEEIMNIFIDRSRLYHPWWLPRAEAKEDVDVVAVRACTLVEGEFVYLVKVTNRSGTVVTNVAVTMIAYPKDCLVMASPLVQTVKRLGGGATAEFRFILRPSKDCVEGQVVANVAYIDYKDRLHSLEVQPLRIRSVCDLLTPKEPEHGEVESLFRSLVGTTREMKLEWNADVLLQKARSLLPKLNFYLIDVEENRFDGDIIGTIRGFALGKYTGKRVAVSIRVAGPIGGHQSTVRVDTVGDDAAMLPTTVEELSEKIDSWLCLRCGSELDNSVVATLTRGVTVVCPYCSSALTLDLYCGAGGGPAPKTSIAETMESAPHGVAVNIESAVPQTTAQRHSQAASRRIVEGVQVMRGCEVVGNKFVYKIKVKNDSNYVITNVVATIVGYPSEQLQLEGDPVKTILRIEVGGFRSPEFILIPTKDCVEGKILATVSFIDYRDGVHTINVRPYTIRSVCDLLRPVDIMPQHLDALLDTMESTQEDVHVNCNPRILFKKILALLPSKNFFVVDSTQEEVGEHFVGTIRGFAEGKYTSARMAAVIRITGKKNSRSSLVGLQVLGDDLSMVPTTAQELKESASSWLCLHCGAPLDPASVMRLKGQVPVKCDSCGHTLSIELYTAVS